MPENPNDMNKPGHHRGLLHVLDATRYSMKGLRAAWKDEVAFRIELGLLLVMLPLALWMADGLTQGLLLVMSCLIVLLVEMLNSAIEAVVDRVGLEHHPLSGRAKDLGSAAVFISLVQVVIVWGAIAWQRFSPALLGVSA